MNPPSEVADEMVRQLAHIRNRALTNREYRDLRGTKKLLCLKCGKSPVACWSWDNDPPYSQCCQAPVTVDPR